MRKFYADVKNIKPIAQIPENANKVWENEKFSLYYTYDPSKGKVVWIMVNKTKERQYVSLLRGASLMINGVSDAVPPYCFGDAFAEIYFANGLSSFITSLLDIPLYSLAVLKDTINGTLRIAFVFQIPAEGIIEVPEYGFVGLQSVNGKILDAKAENINMYAVIYDYVEVAEYEQEAGVQVSAPPDPYAVYAYLFNVNDVGYPVTQRVIFEIPQEDINVARSLIKDVKGFFDKLKKMF